MRQLLGRFLLVLTMTVAFGCARMDDEREEKPRFKCVELYSWKDNGGNWVFALLNGTNRLKTEAEVKADKDQIKGVEGLEKALARLAVGEHVSWTHHIKGFEMPLGAMRTEIEKVAVEAKIDLQSSRQEG